MMMRRKPYAELPGVGLSVGKKATPEPPRSSPATLPMRAAAPAPRNSPGMKPETVRKFTAEIRNLSLLLDQHRLKTDADGQKMCSYTEEKLAQAEIRFLRSVADYQAAAQHHQPKPTHSTTERSAARTPACTTPNAAWSR